MVTGFAGYLSLICPIVSCSRGPLASDGCSNDVNNGISIETGDISFILWSDLESILRIFSFTVFLSPHSDSRLQASPVSVIRSPVSTTRPRPPSTFRLAVFPNSLRLSDFSVVENGEELEVEYSEELEEVHSVTITSTNHTTTTMTSTAYMPMFSGVCDVQWLLLLRIYIGEYNGEFLL